MWYQLMMLNLGDSHSIPSPLDPAFFPGVVQQFYPEQASAILQSGIYDPTELSSADATRDSLVALGTDFNWCAEIAAHLAEHVYSLSRPLGSARTSRRQSI